MGETNRQVVLNARPLGFPKESDFRLVESALAEPGSGEFSAKTLYLSVDPYMRARMNDVKSYAPPVNLGEVMVGGAVSRVLVSNHPDFSAGEVVEGRSGWQSHFVSRGEGMRKVEAGGHPLSTALGVLGMPGLTAYAGLLDICRPREGETVVVSGAAGAVGSLVGQIAKIKGCRAVGIAGTDEKVAYLQDELGFDAAFNYKTVNDYRGKLAELCPDGIDIYFDNVGGTISDAVFGLINVGARISICGQISQYNLEKPEMGPRLLWTLIVRQARVEGFLVSQFADKAEHGRRQLAQWLDDGKLLYREQFADGLKNAPSAFIAMLKGANTGKQLVRVAPE